METIKKINFEDNMKANTINTITWVVIFSIAMGLLETAVVVYMRKLYYPEGFAFPLKMMSADILYTELLREVATLIMLLAIGIIAGRNNIERFAYFLVSFAVWDIFYYLFLKILLNWPESLMTWDILFLIPITWVGPVIAPVINSVIMIILGSCIIYFNAKKGQAMIRRTDWILLIAGSLVVIYSYIKEFSEFMFQKFSLAEILDTSKMNEIMKYSCDYIPASFNWWIFTAGVVMHIAAVLHIIVNNKKNPA